ncbi:hypothetical protein [Stagnihabitans tardus]|uniref:Uncharacterized protein n=1 Tax=Stagnihabitans tardus TaxID=2699202 RepID=A0AAE4Y6U6_9RHOB|nr:hypothetical protein [Stagnihabitans tardus]NBZ86941.1 hypothetical protein [Stagnihabitans tardus]
MQGLGMGLGRGIARFYLALYDLAMRLGPLRGALVIGYGPILAAILVFLVKTPLLDPVFGATGATLFIFVVFAAFGPLMNTGSKVVTEIVHFRRKGAWPGAGPLDRPAAMAPTMQRIEALRIWARGGDL